MSYGLFFLGCVAIVFAFAYWMKDRDDEFARQMRQEQSNMKLAWDAFQKNLHLKYVTQDEMNSAILKLSDSWRESYDLMCKDRAQTYKLLKKDIADVQDHCARLREGQFELQNQVSKKRPLIRIPKGPIQLEIYTPSKNLGSKKPKKAAGGNK